jgi:hypothetical protein
MRLAACFEAHDWSCTFDSVETLFKTSGAIENCVVPASHDCSAEMIAIVVSGIGIAEKSSLSDSRVIAERALDLLDGMNGGVTEGEIAFSALRYEACKSVDDQACIAESADMIRLARVNGYGHEDSLTDMAQILGEYGVRHPLDLALIMTEVAGVEMQQ